MDGSLTHILQSLVVRGYGSYDHIEKINLIINKDGILAGQILIETNNLKNTLTYKKWSWDWYFLYYMAGVLITIGVIKGLVDLGFKDLIVKLLAWLM